jgi:hypothetical protein
MDKKTYKFKAGNWVIFVLTFIFSLVGGTILLALILPRGMGDYSLVFFFILLFSFVVFMTGTASFARVEITIDSESVLIKWVGRFLFYKKRNVIIFLNEVSSYVDSGDTNWEWLKVEKKDGKIYKIYHSNWFFRKGDYSEFVTDFITTVKNYNNAIKEISTKENEDKVEIIKRSKSIYETTGGLIFAGFSIVVIIGLPILLFLFPPSSKSTNYFGFLIGYGGAIYFLIQVYLHKKGKKTDD